MTTKKMIEYLKQFPDNTEVYIYGLELKSNAWEAETRKACVPIKKYVRDNKIATRPCKETAGSKMVAII